jgi:transposase-like protein
VSAYLPGGHLCGARTSPLPPIRRRRRFSKEFKRQVVEETLARGTSVAAIAMAHRLNANQVFTWRRKFLRESAVTLTKAVKMLPVTIEAPSVPLPMQRPSRNTLTLLLPFASARSGRPIDRMTAEDLSPGIVRRFLDHLERERHCGGATRNQRLSTIHSLARFVGMRSPVHLSWCTEVRSIPFKKTAKTMIGYLEKAEMDALLMQPDRRTTMGTRDHTLLLFLYNSGARADEAAQLTIGSLRLGEPSSARILGKGNKLRMCPLWPIQALILDRNGCSEPSRGPTVRASGIASCSSRSKHRPKPTACIHCHHGPHENRIGRIWAGSGQGLKSRQTGTDERFIRKYRQRALGRGVGTAQAPRPLVISASRRHFTSLASSLEYYARSISTPSRIRRQRGVRIPGDRSAP